MASRSVLFGGGVAVGVAAALLVLGESRSLQDLVLRVAEVLLEVRAKVLQPFRHEGRPVFRIALTGGPCAGKSSSLLHFRKELRKKGFSVYEVPEIPGVLIKGGCRDPGFDGGKKHETGFDSAVFRLQMQAEEAFLECAVSQGKPAVIVSNRGLMDIAAHTDPASWQQLLRKQKITEAQLLARYDLVLHLLTAADGAESHYRTTHTRTETPDTARKLDYRVRMAWSNHPNRVIAENIGQFRHKLDFARDAVLKLVQPS